ncbi:protein PTCD3 homolog, mitochondrial [Diachasma alloeum]|uniref:protein PTCD3 homolog, mitochondrial n=1 Tax=Diachasma alloeum TaxID=454923 RepID=UPI00073840BD|nr:protein PTCD3 homolog, mitochondrial [Diachasma alloeum]
MKSFGIKISHRGLIQSTFTRLQSTAASTPSKSSTPEIQIPVKKQRGPTDILQALEKTISRDPTAPKYKYHDDPYLIPYSNLQKRTFALAQESGRKTAMWIRAEHSKLFQHRVADPVIEVFLPKAVYTDKAAVSEEILKNVIKNGQTSDAIAIYQLLEEQVSDETKESLLELLCYYNNNEKFPEELSEEKWFRRTETSTTWKYCPVTDKLFATLKDKDEATAAKAYNAMICGQSKYLKIEAAWNLFQEAEKKGYPIAIETYNQLIGIISYRKDGPRERLAVLMEIYNKMQTACIQPNTETLANSLKLAAAIPRHSSAMEVCRDIFTEFKAIGVEPSLSCYYYALVIYYKKAEASAPPSSLLREIIANLERRKDLKMENSMDTFFFMTAMEVAANNLEDPIFADRIHKLLLTNDNYKLIGDAFKENLYYRHYFQVHVENNALDEFMKSYYDLIVPHVYTPEPNIMNAILQAVSANDPEIGMPLLPRLWTHLVQFNYLERKDLVSKALHLMTTHCIPPKNSPVHQMYADAAWTVWNFVMAQRNKKVQQISWTGPILGDVAILCLRADDFDKWTQIITFMFTQQNSIIGPPSAGQIDELFNACILGGHAQSALDLIHYCSDIGFENVPSMAYKLHVNLPLVDHQMNRLKSLVDPEVLKIRSEDSR